MGFDTARRIASPTGATLNLYTALPPGAPRAVVQVNHGLAEHAARYGRFARFLAGHGFATYAHDHRGHGATTAPGATLGSFGGGADTVIADVAAVHDLIGEEQPGLPVIVFGHSMGALIALNFVFRHHGRIAGTAIWNGNFSAGLLGRLAQAVLAWETFRLGSDVPSRILPRLTFQDWARKVTDGRTPFDWLSRDHAQVDAYVADPLCGFDASVGMWKGVFELVFAGADDRNFAGVPRGLPFHIVGGAKDPATDFAKATEHLAGRLRRMGFSNPVSRVYAQTRHESLNELNRDVIMEDFAEWAEGVVAGGEAGHDGRA
ncbi:MAG: alpha/beta hydrolase [Aquamicrobium sp.]|uniref:alpha/beta fold hydrolase n=1 Tax=Aquamicrobium sp. TaxID=1872579 RepID=UPI00349E7ACE|nr:alpha/beta hydrolase [Aquamicrobium sp.]